MAEKPIPEYLTTGELSKLVNITVNALERMRCEGRGPPFVRFGRSVRYHWPTVQAWMAAQKAA